MAELLLILTPIALVDSLSPVRIGALVAILAGRRFLLGALAFLVGIFSSYFVLGIAISLGAHHLIGLLFPAEARPVNFALGGAVGIILFAIGATHLSGREIEHEPKREPNKRTPAAVFLLSWIITLTTAPAAVPYLAAIDQILKSNVEDGPALAALTYYCLVYLTPFVLLLALRASLGRRSENLLDRVDTWAHVWVPRAMAILFVALGLLLMLDAAGYFFFDRPLWTGRL